MARIRSIKPSFFRHEELYEAERKHKLPLRLAFAGLWTVCDREGRFRWKPRVLKLDVMPFDEVDFGKVLDALADAGFVVKYQVGGEVYGCIPSWAKHQQVNVREQASEIPALVQQEEATAPATKPEEPKQDECAHTTKHVHAHDLSCGEQEREGNREQEGKKTTPRATLRAADLHELPADLADEFLAHRKRKRANLTPTAWDGIKTEALKAGMSPADAVRKCLARGWTGFDAAWVAKDRADVPSETPYQRSMRERFEIATGRRKTAENVVNITPEIQLLTGAA